MPKVSIHIASRNRSGYLPELFKSIFSQTFRDFDVVFVDDGSEDGTPEFVRDYQTNESRLRLISHANKGISQSRNIAAANSDSKYICVMDDDDIMMPARLEKQVHFLEENPGFVLVGSSMLCVDQKCRPLRLTVPPSCPQVLRANLLSADRPAFAHPAVMFRRDAFERVGGYDESFPFSLDYELFLRLTEVGLGSNLPDCLLKYRIHGKNLSSSKAQEWHVARQRALRKTIDRIGVDAYLQQRHTEISVFPDEENDLLGMAAYGGYPSTIVRRTIETLLTDKKLPPHILKHLLKSGAYMLKHKLKF